MKDQSKAAMRLGKQIFLAMVLGCLVGLALKYIPFLSSLRPILLTYVFQLIGHLFISLIKMLVVPIVLISLICGAAGLSSQQSMGKIGAYTLAFYLITTAVAVALALLVATLFNVGGGVAHALPQTSMTIAGPSNFLQVIKDLIPVNPFLAMTEGRLLQVIVFALLFGLALGSARKKVKGLYTLIESVNEVLMRLITMIMMLAPYGVFCLLSALFAEQGLHMIGQLLSYFFVVLLVLLLQASVVYSGLLMFFSRLNPKVFFNKMLAAMSFAFSVSSSSASIPIVLKTVEQRLGVSSSIASFVIPMGATINMDGTAIMQGVATVFIAHVYHVSIGLGGYLSVIAMATLASIGTAGVPGVGLITLAMVLKQVNLPVEGIALIIGVDRLLDMARTAVNIAGDAMVSCLVADRVSMLDRSVYSNQEVQDV